MFALSPSARCSASSGSCSRSARRHRGRADALCPRALSRQPALYGTRCGALRRPARRPLPRPETMRDGPSSSPST
jgi:hypothetical protein